MSAVLTVYLAALDPGLYRGRVLALQPQPTARVGEPAPSAPVAALPVPELLAVA